MKATRIAKKSPHRTKYPQTVKQPKPKAINCQWSVGDERTARQIDFARDHLCCLIEDASKTLPSYRSADVLRDKQTVRRRIVAEGMPFATRSLPSLIQGLFDLLEGRKAAFPGFRIRNGAPVFLNGLFHAVLSGSEAEQQYGLNHLYSISVAFKKLRGPYEKSVLRDQYAEFERVDAEILDIDLFSDDRYHILSTARCICRNIIKDITIDEAPCLPRPGPGATNTPVEKHMRYRPHKLYAQIERQFPAWDGWYSSHPWNFVVQSDIYRRLYANVIDEPTSRFKFVPKTQDKARGICIEENEVQFLQQAVRRLITRHILRDKHLKTRIALNDQNVNAGLALKSSLTRDMSTIDMSDASDRVARDLVSWLFQDNPDLHDALMALSTKWIEPPKEAGGQPLMRTNKFAPMGSALCFPVMSLVHFCLCRAIILLSDIADRQEKSHSVYVYGDDIVIPSDCYTAITDWLPRFGMKLNQTKSFVHSHFRESCGIHAYKGHDITPVYVKHIPYPQSIGTLCALLAVERDLFLKGFTSTAGLHRKRIQECFWNIPEVPLDSPVIGFKRPSVRLEGSPALRGAFQKRRWSDDLHCWEYLATVLIDKLQVSRIPTEHEALLHWQCTGSEESRKTEDSLELMKLAKRWVLESALGSTTTTVSDVKVRMLNAFLGNVRREQWVIQE